MSDYKRRRDCRGCGGHGLIDFLSLGPQPLANALPREPAEFDREAQYPLDVSFCPSCTLVQTPDVVDPEVLFGHYLYVTGTSETMGEHNRAYAEAIRARLSPGPEDLVVEAGSNDGSLLARVAELGVRTLGIDPARNITPRAREKGIECLDRMFGLACARDVLDSHGPARAILANNVFAHVDEPLDFLEGCRTLLAHDGRLFIEVPYLSDLLEHLEYDTVYHEHLSYFSIRALDALFARAGLSLLDVGRVAVHGGSVRLVAGYPDADRQRSVGEWLAEEERTGLGKPETWERFTRDVEESRRTLLELLDGLRAAGKTVAGYGAPAKGNTLLNYCGIGPDRLPYTVDRNPLKVGRYTPGMHIPVRETGELLAQQPDLVLILAWNFAEEIMRQQDEYRQRGGQFILPIPRARVV